MSWRYQSTSYVCMLRAFLSSDHVTAATGKTIAITISKAGAAFGNPNAGATNATEVSSGWYKVTLDTTDTGTLGELVIRGTNADIDDVEKIVFIVVAPATTTDLATVDTVVDAIKAKTDSLTFTVAGQVDANIQYVNDVEVDGTGASGDEWGPV